MTLPSFRRPPPLLHRFTVSIRKEGYLIIERGGDRVSTVSDIRPEGSFPPNVPQESSVPVRQSQPPPPPGPPPFPDSLREKIYNTLSQLEAEIQKGEFTSYSALPTDHFILLTIKALV